MHGSSLYASAALTGVIHIVPIRRPAYHPAKPMSPTDSFSLFINIIDLLDMLFRVLCWVLPRTQISYLDNALDGTKKDLQRAEEMGIEVQEFKKDMQMYVLFPQI